MDSCSNNYETSHCSLPLNAQPDTAHLKVIEHQIPQLSRSIASSYHIVASLHAITQRASGLLDMAQNSGDLSSAAQTIRHELSRLVEGLKCSWNALDTLRFTLGELVSEEYLLHAPEDAQIGKLLEKIRSLAKAELSFNVDMKMRKENDSKNETSFMDSESKPSVLKLEPPMEVHKSESLPQTDIDDNLAEIQRLNEELGHVEALAWDMCATMCEEEKQLESAKKENGGLQREVERLRRENEELTKERNRACLERNRLRASYLEGGKM